MFGLKKLWNRWFYFKQSARLGLLPSGYANKSPSGDYMPFLVESEVRASAPRGGVLLEKKVLNKAFTARADSAPVSNQFDVFLSHSSNEPEELLYGVQAVLERHALTVYIDKLSDPGLSRDGVTPDTAKTIRMRMRQSRSLLYVYSQYSIKSRWMPWELGYFDGLKDKVGILPVFPTLKEGRFEGEEYLGLYPYVDGTVSGILWINSLTPGHYARLPRWVKGTQPITLLGA